MIDLKEIYKNLFDDYSYGLLILDENGKILDANFKAKIVLDLEYDDLIGRSISDFLNEKMKSLAERFLSDVNKEQTIIVEYVNGQGIFSSDSEILFEFQKVSNKNKRIFVVKMLDLQHTNLLSGFQYQIKEILKEFSKDNEFGIMFTKNKEILYINKKLEELIGYSFQELKGGSTDYFKKIILKTESRNNALEQILKFFMYSTKQSKNILTVQSRINTKDKRVLWINFIIKKIFVINNDNYFLIIFQDISEFKENEKKFEIIVENSPIGIFISQSGKIKYMNSRFTQIMEIHQDELLCRDSDAFFEFVHEDDIHLLKSGLIMRTRGIDGKGDSIEPETKIFQFRIVLKNGAVKWIQSWHQSIFFQGRPANIVFIMDITEKKTAIQLLSESEEKFKIIAEKSPLGIGILQNEKFVYFNQRICEINGYSREEIKEWGPYEYLKTIHPNDHKSSHEIIESEDEEIEMELKGISKSGEIKFMKLYTRNLFINGVESDLVMLVDLTDIKTTQQKLIVSEKKFRHLFEKASIPIVLIDKKGKIIDINTEVERIFGLKKENNIGEHYSKFRSFLKKDVMISTDILNDMLVNRIKDKFEIELFDKNGDSKWFEVHVSNFKIEDDNVVQVIMYDITTQKES
ncbi:MAG: PAS domain S-box protein, partial [Promethearchaeota archaeon]